MNQTYGLPVVPGGYRGNGDGISVTFDQQNFCVVGIRIGEYSQRRCDLLVDIAASLRICWSCVISLRNPQMMNTRLGTVKGSRWRRWRKVCLFPFMLFRF